ncbi:MAG: heavy metal translocating P-type ATPase [Roseibacillus sp.]
MSNCLHCGTPNPSPEAQFCCSGCDFVYQTLTSEGFDRFYDLKGKNTGIPVKDRPFQPQDLAWLEKATNEQTTLTVAVNGVTCIGCVWLIEKLFLRLPGAQTCAIFPDTGQANFTWSEGNNPTLTLAQELPRYGYTLSALDTTKQPVRESSKLLARLGITSAFALNAMAFTLPRYLGMKPDFAFAQIFEIVTLLSATFALLIGGTYFFTRAIAALRRGTLHIDLPISLGLILAFIGSLIGYFIGEERLLYFDFVAIFTTLMLGGRYLHLAASEKARSNLTRTSALPESIELITEDGKEEIPTRALTNGNCFLLPVGQPLPVTAMLQDEDASLSLAWINGEPEPRHFQTGQRIPSGAVNLSAQSLTLTADEDFPDSLVAKLTQSSDRTQSSPLLQKLLKIYLLIVLIIGVGGGLAWLIVAKNPVDALQVAISIFIVSCPCALGVAIPLADRRAATHLQSFGVFVQNTLLWQRLMHLKALVLDKTGTLTLEHPTLQNPELLETLSTNDRQALLHLTASSLHPLSRTLHAALATDSFGSIATPEQINESPGQGIETTINGTRYHLGKPNTPSSPDTEQPEGPTTTFTRDDQTIATFHFLETARPDAARALAATHIPVHILSGDGAQRVKALATSLQLDPDLAHGDLSPDDKAAHLSKLNPALFLGDGANDSIAFDTALATGSPVADRSLLDTKADFLFTQPGLSFLPHLLATARWRHRIVRRVLAFTIVYNTTAITFCLMGHMNPLLAAIFMPLSSLASLAIASAQIQPKAKTSPTAPDLPLSRVLPTNP